MQSSPTRLLIFPILGWILWIGGCRPAETVNQYPIPKETYPSPPQPKRDAMLAAIVPGSEKDWFFKVAGPVVDVNRHADNFAKFMKSVSFENSEPKWTLPEGWVQQSGENLRFATIKLGDDPLELTVFAFPKREGDPKEQLLQNINRWRGQMTLRPISIESLPTETFDLALPSGETATLVSLVGRLQPMPPGGAPFMQGGGNGE